MAVRNSFMVYDARDFRVSAGANFGDPLLDAGGVQVADAYGLDSGHARKRLDLECDGPPCLPVTISGTEAGPEGGAVSLSGSVSLMSPVDLSTFDIALLKVDDGSTCGHYIVSPLPLRAHQDYVAVAAQSDTKSATAIMGQLTAASFTAGTRLLTGERRQVAVKALKVGDLVQTRDHGVQPIRWIGSQTVRAEGLLAPITIEKGAMHNIGPLSVSPMHRLFIYQRRDTVGAGRAEVMIAAETLVNGVTVTKSSGGFVDYFQLLFDQHEIVYAEGVAMESQITGRMFAPADADSQSVPGQSYEALKQAFIRSEYERHSLNLRPDHGVTLDDLMEASRG